MTSVIALYWRNRCHNLRLSKLSVLYQKQKSSEGPEEFRDTILYITVSTMQFSTKNYRHIKKQENIAQGTKSIETDFKWV